MDMPKAEVGVIIEGVKVSSKPLRLHLGSIQFLKGYFSESRMVCSNKEADKHLGTIQTALPGTMDLGLGALFVCFLLPLHQSRSSLRAVVFLFIYFAVMQPHS